MRTGLCIEHLAKDELGEYLGALSPASMRSVNQALAIALALPEAASIATSASGITAPG